MSQVPQPPADQPAHTTHAIKNFAVFVQMLEDGQFNAELSKQLSTIAEELTEHADSFGKAKGKLNISIDFTLKDGVFDIKSNFEVKLPKAERARSVLWMTGDHHFIAVNPRQMHLFGGTPLRDVTSEPPAEVRSV